MPKTYNSRQIEQMKLEAAHAAVPESSHDIIRHVRFFSHEEIAALVDRIEARIATDKITQLKPDTAYLVTQALRAWAAEPRREAVVREICRFNPACEKHCLECTGKANAVMGIYKGRSVR